MSVRFKRVDGAHVELSADVLQAFKTSLRGSVLAPDDRAHQRALIV